MKAEDITFENMVHKLPEAIPELRAAYDRQIQWWGAEEPAAHAAYEEIVSKAIGRILRTETPDERLLQKIFDFLELLANHPEERVQEVVHNSLCEPICSDELALQRTQKYMGPRTRDFCKTIVTWEPPKK